MSQDGRDDDQQRGNQPVDQDFDELSAPPSNKKLLCIAFVSFQSFALVQIGVSIYAGSEAMLGDSIAMMVDALTYLFNLIAERQKEVYASKLREQHDSPSTDTQLSRSMMILQYRKYTYQLELIPPAISVSTLLVVTVLVLKESIHTLILDRTRDSSEQSDPNVNLMVMFSFFNLLLDLVNVGCFASASHALGYKTNPETSNNTNDDDGITTDKIANISSADDNCEEINSDEIDTKTSSLELHDNDDRFIGDDHDESTNLNMCSAYTHVFADTLRSFAVIFASLLAKFTTAITSEVADAAAAVVVSILIFLSLFPLISGMIQTFKSLKDVNRSLKKQEFDEKGEGGQVELLNLV